MMFPIIFDVSPTQKYYKKDTKKKKKNRRQIEGRRRTQKKFKFFLLGFRDLKLETKRL
jgi:hypothetical protein